MQANTRQVRANTGNRIALGVLIILVSLFSFLSDVGALGGVGRMVSSFTVGFFGLADFAYSVMGVIIGAAVIFNLRVRMPLHKILTYFGLLAIGIFILHIYSSSAHIVGSNYGEYLLLCYQKTNTAGGMLFGIAAFPLMKLLTTVGALILGCVAFFVLASFAFFPVIKKNVTYSASSKSERDVKRREKSGTKLDVAQTPAIVDFSQRDENGSQGLYVVDVEGDPMKKGNKKAKGASGYNPLYPNANGGIEDEEIRPISSDRADRYSARGIARDILFGNNPDEESLRKFNTANNPTSALSEPAAPYSAVRRRELRNRLGIDEPVDRDNSYTIPRTEHPGDIPEKAYETPVANDEDKPLSATPRDDANSPLGYPSFEALKAEQLRLFGERVSAQPEVKPEFSATAYVSPETVEPLHAEVEKKEVIKPVKPVKRPEPMINPSTPPASNMAGLSGTVARAITGEELPPPPAPKKEIETEAYVGPTEDRRHKTLESASRHDDIDARRSELSEAEQPVASRVESFQRPPVSEQAKIDWQTALHGAMPNNQSVEKGEELANSRPAFADIKPVAERPIEVRPSDSPATQHVVSNLSDASSEKPIDSDGIVYQQSFIAKKQAEAVAKAKAEAPAMSALEKARADQERASKQARKVSLPSTRDTSMKAVEKKAKELENIDITKERVVQVTIDQSISQATRRKPYKAPPMSLLIPPEKDVPQDDDVEAKKAALIEKLQSFDIDANILDLKVGPTFSLYTLSVVMPKGRTIGSLTNLESDIAMKMEEESVRILAPIPGKNAVGIEVPNKRRKIVRLSELLNSTRFNTAESPATFGLGKDLYGTDYVCDVKELPHLLIAGQTGAGKSCCINSLIISLLYKASPEEVRLILIDPKRVELSVYAGIPHLMLDEIVCDVDKAIRALNWAIAEMNRRIEFLTQQKARDIDEYNRSCEQTGFEKMPRIIIIVDELADLMSLGKKAVEEAINRIARLARAVGIHLILATQRPSVDVISGTIKSNLPTRVAFRVPSGADSRTVLDAYGADKLLGNGDMLYKMPKAALPTRMQGAFISNDEVKAVVDFLKENNESYYDQSVKDAIFKAQEEKQDNGESKADKRKQKGLPPELFDALRIGMEESISVSYLQRKLGLGWQKAAKIGDIMDDMGVLVPDEKDPKRKRVNLTEEEFQELIRANEAEGDDE